MSAEKLPKPHYTFTFAAGFLILSIIRYYWPESGLTIYNVIVLSLVVTCMGMLQTIVDKLQD